MYSLLSPDQSDLDNDTSSSSLDPTTTTWTDSTTTQRVCFPSCQVTDITSDTMVLEWNCCNSTENYTLQFDANISQDQKTKCSCGDREGQVEMNDCDGKLSGLCPNTEYLLALSNSQGSAEIHCTHAQIETLKTKPAAPTKATWDKSKFNETAVELTWNEPDCLNGDDLTYQVLHWTGSEIPSNGSKTRETRMTLHSLSPKTTYNFQVIACNSEHCSNSDIEQIRTKAGKPSEPMNFQSQVVSSSVIGLTWNPPRELGGPNIDGYQIFYRLQGISTLDNRTEEVGGGEKHFEVTGLVPGKTYLFIITAYHNVEEGKKLFGQTSPDIEATTDPSEPSEPQNLLATNVTSNQVTLTWEEPEIENGNIDGYLVRWTSLSYGDGSKNDTTKELAYTVTALLPWEVYDFSVAAFNLLGGEKLLGSAAHLNTTTLPAGPSPPTNLTALAINSSAIQLKWGRPDDPRGPIDHYNIVCWQDGNDTASQNITLEAPDELEHLVSDLQPWTNYTCIIWAVNMDGDVPLPGEPSDVTTRTRQDKPSAPRNLQVANITSSEVHLRWEAPEHANGPLDGYKLSWFPEANSAIQEDLLVNVSSATVSVLLPWKEYNFSVLAFNYHYQDGKGQMEGPSLSVVAMTRPAKPGGHPEELSVTYLTSRSLGVSWLSPKEPNGPIDGYLVSLCPSGDDCWNPHKTELMEMNFTNLHPYQTYTVKVGAFNLDEEDILEGPWDTLSRKTSVDAPSVPTQFMCTVAGANELKVMWNAPDVDKRNGPLDGYILRWRRQEVQDDHNTTDDEEDWQSKNFTDLKDGTQKDVICDLHPYTAYEIRVSAFNLDDNNLTLIGEDVESFCQTDVGAPSAPNLDVRSVSFDSVELTWKRPELTNGPLDGYKLFWKMSDCPGDVCNDETLLRLDSDEESFVVKDLLPWSNYTFGLMAFNRVDRKNLTVDSGKSLLERRTHAGVPEYPVMNLTIMEAMDTKIQFLFPTILFRDLQGPIVRYAVVVAGLDNSANISKYQRRQGQEMETMGTWSQAKNNYPMPPYQASPVSWNPYNHTYDPFECQDHNETNFIGKKCTIGAEIECNATTPYCNGPLHSGNYAVKIRGFTDGGWSETHPLQVFVESSEKDASSSTGVAVGVSLTFLLLVGALIGGVFMKKKGLWPKKMTSTTPASKPEDLNTPMTPIPPRRTGTCIQVPAFSNHVAVMLSDSGLKFSLEFEELKAASPELPNLVACLPGNKPKNRWLNILPFDHSRVKLRPISDDQETDYINASYIPGNSCRREYIASQGPLPSTKDDFWRMIWEQNVSMVVMLTLCVERGKPKCEQYWRDDWEPHYHGDDCIKVVKISESILSAYTIRIFDIQMGGNQRSVKHMHFTKWPDFGCPENPEILINFVRAVRDHLPHSRPSPILVHCSAGVGRTGTFIAVDRLMQQVREKSEYLDVYRMVLEMRDHRCSMVQTEDQYIYIHECVREIIHDEEERTQTPVPNGFEIYSNLNFNPGE